MTLSTKAIEVINTIANLVPINEQIKICAANKVAIKELRELDMIDTGGKQVKLTKKGKELCSALGNTNHQFAASLEGYNVTMVSKYLMSNKEGTFYYTDEVTFKRDTGSTEEVVTRVNVKKEESGCGATAMYWKRKD